MRYFFEIAYKGTAYHGWQMQSNAISVQQVVTETLSTLLRQKVEVMASGRTDTGVHCEQQFFHADLDNIIDGKELQYKLNSFLPNDISIQSIQMVKPSAHARFDAVARSYQYRITAVKDPFSKGLKYYCNKTLDVQTMNTAATLLIRKGDFECFSKVKTEVNNFICDITAAKWIKSNNNLTFQITANRFLRGMVRAVVGTLLDVGEGKSNVEKFEKIIDSKDRKTAGRSAPAHGLYLTEVSYPKDIFI